MLHRASIPDRHKRFRRRRKAGIAVATVEFDSSVVDFLVKTRWLAPDESHDRDSIGKALSRMLADAARR
jgi:hypothetical protein